MTCFYDSVKNKRSENEDSFAKMEYRLNHEAGVYALAVADGMGGLSAGREYADMAVRLWHRELLKVIMGEEFAGNTLDNQIDLLKEFSAKIFGKIGRMIYRKGIDTGVRGGTTLSAVIRFWDTIIVANVGDSPVYGICNGDIRLLSEIQNVSGKMIREGKTEQGSILYYQNKNRLLQYLGSREEVFPHCVTIDVRDVDYILMGTDGAFGDLKTEEISEIVSTAEEARIVIRQLFERAREYGEEDNQTAILYLPRSRKTRKNPRNAGESFVRNMDEIPAVMDEESFSDAGEMTPAASEYTGDMPDAGEQEEEPFPIPEIHVISSTAKIQTRRGVRIIRKILLRNPFSRRS